MDVLTRSASFTFTAVLLAACSQARTATPPPSATQTPRAAPSTGTAPSTGSGPAQPASAEPASAAAYTELPVGDYLWQAPPFERLPLADAKRYCQERHSGLLPPSVFFQQYARHHEEMTTHGTFWTDAPPVSGDGAAVDWMLPVDDQGNARTGQTWHDPSERLLVRCARLNPDPPPPPPADTEPASCDTISVKSECMEHDQVALRTLSAETRSQICVHLGHGTYRREHCPADDQVGRCALAGGQTRHYYSTGGAPYDEARARTACGSRGDFTVSSR